MKSTCFWSWTDLGAGLVFSGLNPGPGFVCSSYCVFVQIDAAFLSHSVPKANFNANNLTKVNANNDANNNTKVNANIKANIILKVMLIITLKLMVIILKVILTLKLMLITLT